MSTPCSWFQLHKPSNGVKDVEIQLALDGSRVGSEPACPAIEGPLTGDGILSIVRSKARPISWEASFEGMRLIKIQGGYGQHWFFTPGYKPFYLIIPS
jgi:hypothetical protein